MMPILSHSAWNLLIGLLKDNLWKILTWGLPISLAIAGFFLKIPQFFKLLYYLRQHSRGKVEVVGNIIKILKRLGVTTQIAQAFQNGRYAINDEEYTLETSNNIYFHLSDTHKQKPFCTKCYPTLSPMTIFDYHHNRWKCTKCDNFNKPQPISMG